jgi:hypothetical protein
MQSASEPSVAILDFGRTVSDKMILCQPYALFWLPLYPLADKKNRLPKTIFVIGSL